MDEASDDEKSKDNRDPGAWELLGCLPDFADLGCGCLGAMTALVAVIGTSIYFGLSMIMS